MGCLTLSTKHAKPFVGSQNMVILQFDWFRNVTGPTLLLCDIVILNFMLDLLSRMNDKDKQQVCGNFRK